MLSLSMGPNHSGCKTYNYPYYGYVIPGRSFEGLADLVTPNKVSYTKRHGYQFVDASDLLDKSRPPSWSKILAVRKYLADYDWVFWNDAVSFYRNTHTHTHTHKFIPTYMSHIHSYTHTHSHIHIHKHMHL